MKLIVAYWMSLLLIALVMFLGGNQQIDIKIERVEAPWQIGEGVWIARSTTTKTVLCDFDGGSCCIDGDGKTCL
jgi:hypothetical protein